MTRAVIFDTETTGTKDPAIVEAAYLELRSLDPFEVGEQFAGRFNPGKPVEAGAFATHFIADEDLVGAPPASSFAFPESVEYVVGHNVDFDLAAIGRPPVKAICTLAFCRRLWPEADSHSLIAMLYRLDRELARKFARGAHSADGDVSACALLLQRILPALAKPPKTFEDLYAYSERARVPVVFSFGKHKGMRIADAPPDYKRWLLAQEIDPYLAAALRGGK